MIDFITQYHDVILWFCFGVAGLVIPGLMGCDEYPGDESKLWKVRLVGLLIIFGCICSSEIKPFIFLTIYKRFGLICH